MILIISTCKEKLHELEFVKPIENILGKDFVTKHYSEINEKDLKKCYKVIICGTSLKDNKFVEDVFLFDWLKYFDKPVFGICAGMQILGWVYGGNLKKKTEIGFYKEKFSKDFLGIKKGEEKEVYHLHNNFIDEKFWKKDFEIVSKGNGIVQAVKHKEKKIYGVLFHPEVRNKEMILEFVNE